MPKLLNDVMEFDLVIRVHSDGSISHAEGVYAPTVMPDYAEKGQDYISGKPYGFNDPREWSLMRGYTGQYGCAGSAHMHNSEFIGGGMERDILSAPGLYVAVVLEWPCDTEYGCDGPDEETGESCDQDHSDGWAVAYLLDEESE